MKREVKFRGKHNYDGHWIYGNLHIQDDECFIYPQRSEEGMNSRDHYEVDPSTVGQQWVINIDTKVYSGDLLECECSPSGSKEKKRRICKVTSCEAGFNMLIWHEQSWWAYSFMNFSSAKLVGNEFDQPELIAT